MIPYRPLPTHSPNRGMAILIVLGALVLVSILTVAFLGSVSKELTASKSYASGASARIHADAAANIALGQIQLATTADDATTTWVSQPGLIRQYDDNGGLSRVFKLYSSDKMVEGSNYTPTDANGKPADIPAWKPSDPKQSLPWHRDPGVYTDLNSPVVVDSAPKYPILNPGGLDSATKIQGFDVSTSYALPDTEDFDADGDTGEIAQIPMPVRWLYILADGRLATATPDSSAPRSVKLTAADGLAITAENPPVARVAFWTDDDGCRLNINTASEGNFWMLPVAAAADDSLATGQVNSKEYQRYPGHPATTSLSPVFDFLTSNAGDLKNFIYALTPRVAGRGSQSGSRYIGYGMPVNPDNDRLYASVDDLLFLPKVNTSTGERYLTTTANIQSLKASELDWKFSGNAFSLAGAPYNFSSNFAMDPQRLELVRFFLTAGSRAPEVNLFGKPRVSLWPVDTRTNYQSIYDRLLAFCSTINNQAYHFGRQNPDSESDDYRGINRNQELLTYLDHFTDKAIPGTGGNFAAKYSDADRKQLLAGIFDWIRCVNLAYRDKSGGVLPYAWQKNPAASGTKNPPGEPGSAQVLPIKIGTSQGFGRFPVLSKAAMAIIREQEQLDIPAPGLTTVRYRVLFLMETYVPLLGFAGYIPNYRIAVTGLSGGFEFLYQKKKDEPIQAVPLQFSNGEILVTVPANIETYTGRAWGGTQGFNNLFLYSKASAGYELTARNLASGDPSDGYPFVSAQVAVVCPTLEKDLIRVGLKPAEEAPLHTVGVTLQDAGGAHKITTYDLPFPAFGPVPGAFLGKSTTDKDRLQKAQLQDRLDQMATAFRESTGDDSEDYRSYKNVIGAVDVVRGLELQHGDLRLLAVQGTNTYNRFVPHADYNDASLPQAHSLLHSGGSFWAGSNKAYETPTVTKSIRRGFLVAGTSAQFASGTPLNYLPQAPSAMGSAGGAGDFTTGIGSEGDGPHIIKADEGNSSFGGMNWGMSGQFPYQNQLFPYDNRLSDAFSPNRQVASAVQLGTLPSQAANGVPWQTLLFRPDFSGAHPGGGATPDYLMLDLFWMPVVDPYPISEPLSTAGKVNMNYQMAPFSYIKRSTAMLGALKSTKILALPKEHAKWYKWSNYTVDEAKGRPPISYLYGIDSEKTLLFFDERFSSSDKDKNIFKSASEICSIPLAPMHNTSSPVNTGHPSNAPTKGVIATVNIGGADSADSVRTRVAEFWQKNTLTGDNVKESPYNALYPRLTTQSNTFTVYVRAQSLQVSGLSGAGRFSESRDAVTAEYRGSYSVERYIDLKDTKLPDFAASENASKTIYPYYKVRIRNAKQFVP